MSDEAKALAVLLHGALSLTLAESESEAATLDHLTEILVNYSYDRDDERNYSEAFVPCDMRTYVETELATRFELSAIDMNLNTDAVAIWSSLLDKRWNSVEYAVALQIIISLVNFSTVNRSNIGAIRGIKECLFHRTTRVHDDMPVVCDRLADLFSLVLTVDCTPADLLELYAHFSKYSIYRTIETLTAQLCDPASQAFVQFENCYHVLKVSRNEETKHTFQFFIEFNSVTSNRIATIGTDLYLEIAEGKFCVSNDEIVMALFEDFEFEAGTLYSIAVIVDSNDISLHVDGNLIDTLTLLGGVVSMFGHVDVGSMICSFKLYRLTIYQTRLSEESLTVIYATGSTFRDAFNEETDLRAIRLALGDTFLERNSSISDSNKHYIDRLLESRQEIDSNSICIDVDPAFLCSDDYHSTGGLSLEDALGYAATGKCLHFKPAFLLPMFKSINCFLLILCSLERMAEWDDLFKLLSHLMSLLQSNHLRAWFKQDYGFPLLSHILITKVQENMKSALPIQFFNLFQEFCGWNFSNITKSIIEDDAAYQALILNSDLWYRISPEVDAGRDGVEILRFSLFQICSLLEASEFRTLNSQKLRSLGVLKNLCINQHLLAEKNGYPSILDELAREQSRVYVLLLKEDLSRGKIQWLLQFAYFELKSGYFKNAEAALAAFDALFIEALDNAETSQIRLITDSVSPKFLLMILDEIVKGRGDPLITLRILLKRLVVNRTVYRNFVKSNGLDLIYAILKNADTRYTEDIVYLLYTHSLGDYNIDLDPKICERLENDTMHNEVTLLMKELLILTLNLLEWAVINDISCSSPADLDGFISAFVKRVSITLEKITNDVGVSPFTVSFLQALTELHATLTRPQNSSIYDASSNAIKQLVSDKIINAMMCFKPDVFTQYLESMTYASDVKAKNLTMDEKIYGYCELSYFWFSIPGVFKGIRDMDNFFSHELFNNNCMIFNFVILFEKLKQYLTLFEFDGKVYIDALECIFICLKGSRERWSVKKPPRSSLSGAFLFTIVVMLRQDLRESQSFNDNCLDHVSTLLAEHSDDIFSENCGLWNEELARLLLWVSLRPIPHSGLTKSGLSSITVLLKYGKEILSHVCGLESSNLLGILESLSISHGMHHVDQEVSDQVRTFIEHNQDIVASYAQSLISAKNLGSVVPQDQLMTEINAVKDAKMEARIKEVERRLQLFQNDNLALDRKVRTGFRKIYGNFVTDRGEDKLLGDQQYSSFAMHLSHTLSLQWGSSGDCNWGLDPVQNSNGMKGHLIPVWSHMDCKQSEGELQRSVQDQGSKTSQQIRLKNTTNSFLSYDLISDVDTLEPSIIDKEDENRKILKSLKDYDSIKKIWNTSLIIGLEFKEGVLILGELNVYFVSNYYFVKEENKVLRLSEVPEANRDLNLNLITGSPEIWRGVPNAHLVHTWRLSDIIFIVKRPFLLRETALEILFDHGTSFFFNFNNKSYRDDVYHILDKLPRNKKIDPVLFSTLQELNSSSGNIGLKNGMLKDSFKAKFVRAFSANLSLMDGFSATRKWQNGEISNFYYLMTVNALAGRTFNDITQYPVFPWVIADYSSEELDLEDPATFRDFTKPMGAQSRRRRAQFVERFELLKALNDPSSPPFHYGTHYSSAMIVSSYLIRLKPYVDSFLLLQDGRFGHADRLFNSIGRAWSSAAEENTTDVRELIPEFFFLPEFLINLNNFSMGEDQQGNQVNEVLLPPWAKGDPKIFISKNREALESPYVSKNLHHWIDLVFGFKQRGEAAEIAVNVFNNLSYPGAVDLDSISDENERRAVTGIIHNFGQTPLQIFQNPHPEKFVTNIKQIERSVWTQISSSPRRTYQPEFERLRAKRIRYIYWESYADGTICWKGYPFLDVMIRSGSRLVPLKLREPFSLDIGETLYQMVHPCRISSFFLWKQQEFLTGDESGLIQVWRFDESKSPGLTCLGKLFGHLSEVKDIRMYSDYSALLSTDVNGTVFLWNLLDYQIIRRISSIGLQAAVSQNQGNIAVYTMDKTLTVYDFGGLHYVSKLMESKATVTCLEFVNFASVDLASKRHAYWREQDVLVVGYENGELEVYELFLGTAWELRKLKQLKSDKGFEISSIRTQLRLSCKNDEDSESSLEIPKLEIMAGDSQGYLHLWN